MLPVPGGLELQASLVLELLAADIAVPGGLSDEVVQVVLTVVELVGLVELGIFNWLLHGAMTVDVVPKQSTNNSQKVEQSVAKKETWQEDDTH